MSFRRPPRRLATALGIATLALLFAACGGGGGGGGSTEPGVVIVQDNVFKPRTLDVAVGDTVTWKFQGKVAHNVHGEGFQSQDMKTGDFTYSFDRRGTYKYVCTIHSGMKGEIRVQ
jgi:plastocyanin